MRNVMIAGTLNRNVSRLAAESNSATTVPTKTITTPRAARRMRQRLRMRRMTSTSSARCSMSALSSTRSWLAGAGPHVHLNVDVHSPSLGKDYHLPGAKNRNLQKFLFSRQAVGNDGFRGQKQQSGEQQIPPEAL